MACGNGSAGGKSFFSLQCSESTPSLPSEIDSSSFSQGSRMGFLRTLPLRRVMTDLTYPCVGFQSYLHLHCIAPLDFVVVEMETYLSLEN